MEFRRPKIYLIQFLLLPIRIVIAVPLVVGFIVLGNVMKALVSLSGFLLFYGIAWSLDRFVWPGLLQMPDWLYGLLIVATYVVLFYFLHRLSGSSSVRTKPKGKNKTFDKMFDFLFEARYIEPNIEIYGPSFREPTFEEYGLQANDYYAYNRRFSFREMEFIISAGSAFLSGFIASYYLPERKFAIGITTGIIVLALVIAFDQWYSRTYPQFQNIRNYHRAKKIYESIQSDIRSIRIK